MDLKQAKQQVQDNLEKGDHCPCCGQFAKLYKRKLNSAMVAALVLINKYFKENPDAEWLHVENYLKSLNIPAAVRGDFPKLRHWGLLEAKTGIREDGSKRVGLYKVTLRGQAFLSGILKVPSRVHLYNQEVLGFSGKEIRVEKALGNKFRYSELMSA